MKDLKHTPGPWPEPVAGSDNGWATMTIEKDGLHVVVTAPNVSEMEAGEWDEPDKVYEMEANAKLVAAAPNMLAELIGAEQTIFRYALADAHKWAGDTSGEKALAHANSVVSGIRAAIQKATQP